MDRSKNVDYDVRLGRSVKISVVFYIEGNIKMVSLNPPVCDFGWQAPHFDLPGVDGRNWTLNEIAGEKGLLVMFICNHCPYVQAILRRRSIRFGDT
jgi:hypothetical protein